MERCVASRDTPTSAHGPLKHLKERSDVSRDDARTAIPHVCSCSQLIMPLAMFFVLASWIVGEAEGLHGNAICRVVGLNYA